MTLFTTDGYPLKEVININLNINRIILSQGKTEEEIVSLINRFIEEVVLVFDENPNFTIDELKISLMCDDNFIFILEDHHVTASNVPYIMKDLLIICRIRRINLMKVNRAFIKVTFKVNDWRINYKYLWG